MRAEQLAPPYRDETLAIWAWRLTMFLEHGFTHDQADLLARTTIDHHDLEKLIERGCPRELALQIVS